MGSVIVRVAAVELCAGRAMKKRRQTGWKLAMRRKVWTPPTSSRGVRAVGTVLEYGKGGTRYCGAKAVFDARVRGNERTWCARFSRFEGVKERLCLSLWFKEVASLAMPYRAARETKHRNETERSRRAWKGSGGYGMLLLHLAVGAGGALAVFALHDGFRSVRLLHGDLARAARLHEGEHLVRADRGEGF